MHAGARCAEVCKLPASKVMRVGVLACNFFVDTRPISASSYEEMLPVNCRKIDVAGNWLLVFRHS
jgi:hypothetical protein